MAGKSLQIHHLRYAYMLALQKDAESFLKPDAPVVFDLTFDVPHSDGGMTWLPLSRPFRPHQPYPIIPRPLAWAEGCRPFGPRNQRRNSPRDAAAAATPVTAGWVSATSPRCTVMVRRLTVSPASTVYRWAQVSSVGASARHGGAQVGSGVVGAAGGRSGRPLLHAWRPSGARRNGDAVRNPLYVVQPGTIPTPIPTPIASQLLSSHHLRS
jgi:hypothetical protein